MSASATTTARAAPAGGATASPPALWPLAGPLSATARYWGVVAAFGALWGALEFTLGSFLHALKLPFGGTLLAAVSAALLVAQRQLLPRRGLSLATGIVAAVCKSVSPGGLILGPMIAITVEALLVETALLPAPRSRAGAILAGALVVCWATFQKVISQYVYLGGTVIDLYIALLERGADLVGLTPAAGWRVLGGVVAAICLVGSAIALWGRGVGRQVARELEAAQPGSDAPGAPRERERERERGGERRPQTRVSKLLTLAVAAGCVALQFQGRLELALLSVVVWLVTLGLVDRRALNRLRMPKFWAIMIVFALGSGLLLGRRDLDVLGVPLSMEGLEAGALMVLRGVFLFGLTSWAARAADWSVFRRASRRVGLGNLAVATGSAFGVLPSLIDRLRRSRAERGARVTLAWARHAVVDALAETARLADRLAPGFETAGRGRARLVVVEGAPGAGKTTAVAGLAAALRARGLAVGGVVQPALPEGGEEPGPGAPRPGYDLEDLASGERRRFARRREGGARGFDFDDEAWAWAAARIVRAQQGCDVVIVDELGRLEAGGGGHVPSIAALADRPGRAAVLLGAVRDRCVEPLAAFVGEPALALRAPIDAAALEAAADEVARLVAGARAP